MTTTDGGCVFVQSWGNVQPEGGYDSNFFVAFASSFASSSFPTDLLTWEALDSVTPPASVTFDGGAYADCEICMYLDRNCQQDGTCSGNSYLATSGTVTVNQATFVEAAGTFSATATNLRLTQWDFQNDVPMGTGCYEIASASINVSWPAAPMDAGMNMTSTQIAAVRSAADAGTVSLPVMGALVTYVVPTTIGSATDDPAGFFVQSQQMGPAVFVAVNPTTLTPAPQVGDLVDFTATEVEVRNAHTKVLAISGYTRVSTGNAVAPLTQNVTTATDLVSALGSYESELITVTGTLATGFTASGAQHSQASLSTTGINTGTLPRFRAPDSVISSLDLQNGCSLTVQQTPMWRFNTTAQPSAWNVADVTNITCPAPVVVSATALTATSVVVRFSRQIASASVMASGAQFTIPGLSVTAAAVNGTDVTLTTMAQANQQYTVTVAGSVTDTRGTALGMPNSAMFDGFVPRAVVRINEINANITGGCDLIELRVISGGSMNGLRLQQRDTETLVTFGSINVAKNDFIVVHINGNNATCNPGASPSETTSISQHAQSTYARNYDTAWDVFSTSTGLTATDNVFTVYDPANTIVDAVLVADAATGTAASGSEAQAAAVATANQWQMVGGGVPAGGFIDNDFRAHAALDLNATGTSATGTTIQRLDDTDDNDKADWNSATILVQAQTWGALNPGQTVLP